jgi:hypothetical protein
LDEATQPAGLEYYNIKDLELPGSPGDFQAIDLDNDGIKEIIYINAETFSLEILSYDKDAAEYSIRKSIKIQPGTSLISIGNYRANVKEKDFAFYTSEGVFGYQPLVTEETIFFPTANQTGENQPIWQESSDLNNDGIDDLIIPTQDGYLICWGPYSGGQPAKKQLISQPADQSIKTTNLTFVTISSSLPNISLIDLNGDGLKDIVLGFAGKLSYHLQDKKTGLFTEQASGEFRMEFLNLPSYKDGSNILIYSNQFADINADGLMDLVIASTSGDASDIGNMTTRIFVFIARPALDRLYATPPAHIINLKGVCPLWGVTEINGDNYPDLFITSFRVSMGSNIKKAILKYIPITYQIYLNKAGKNFSMSPDYERNVNFPASAIGKGTGHFSHIYFGYDLNSDARTDLMIISGPERKKGSVIIYRGRQKDKLTRPDGISFEKDEFLLYPTRIPDKAFIVDLNNDRKKDIILQYRSKLTILIAK